MSEADIEFLAHQDTAIGTLILRRREYPSRPGDPVTEILLDHAFLMSSYNTFSECALARNALALHEADPLQVLVGGLGLGYTAWEVLQSSRVARAEIVEFSPAVIAWMQEGLVPLSGALTAESRAEIVEGDVFQRLADPPASGAGFDLILIDVDHSPAEPLNDAGNQSFYSPEGLRAARRHLAPDGLLGVWSYADSPRFAAAMREVFTEVRVEPVTFMNDLIDEQTTDWLFFARDRE